MARPMQQQDEVVRAVFDRRGEPAPAATIGGRIYRVGDALEQIAADLMAIGAEADAR